MTTLDRGRPSQLSLLAFALVACKSTAEKDREHRDFPVLTELRAKVDRLPEIQKDARARAETGTRALELPEPGAASCIYLDPPDDSHGRPSSPVSQLGFECPRTALRRPGDDSSEKIAACNDIRWVIVLKTRELTRPVVHERTSFRPGVLHYDALVYSFTDGSYLGGTALRATNSPVVEARLGDGETDRLLLDLQRNACATAEQALGLTS